MNANKIEKEEDFPVLFFLFLHIIYIIEFIQNKKQDN